MSRRLTLDERRLWNRLARTLRLAPGRSIEAVEDEPPPAVSTCRPAQTGKPHRAAIAPVRRGPPQDLAGQRRVRRGQSEIDARLDLHGHTQDSAHRELVSFIAREHAAGSRCILVITGKGRLGPGVLRSRLTDWIADPDLRSAIAGYSQAHLRHGGEGAVYIFLKAMRR